MTKKVLNEDKSYFEISKKSIDLTNGIISRMEGSSFHNHYHILYDICESFDKDNIVYLEIGTYCGGSASLVSLSKKVGKIFSIDIGYPIDKKIPINNVTKFKHPKCDYEYIMGSSMDKNIIEYVKENIGSVDILFIDGDHSGGAVIQDFQNYSSLVSIGGYIVFDDYMDEIYSPEVRISVDFIINNFFSDEYEIVGSIDYELISETNCPFLTSSNEFILKRIK